MTLNSQSLNLNARQILFKRLSTAQAIAYTGPLGEVIIDANLKLLRVQDGVTAGGHLMITSNVTANLQAQIDNIKSNLDPAAIDSLTEIIANVNALLANNVESQLINSGFYANLSNTGNLTIDGSLLPKTHLLQDLGSKTRAWRSLYISNATAYFGNAALTVTNNGLQVFNANNQPLPIIANIKFPDGSIQSTAVDMAVLANIYSLLTPNISANLVGINNDVTNAISYFGNLANAAVTTVQANLQSQIDYIKTNIDPAALDSLTEIVTSFQGIDANVIANVSTLTTTVANLTANASSQQSNIDLLLSERSKLVSGSAELVLSAGGAQPYVSFPAATNGSQLQISESELASVAGNLALTSAEDAYIISNGSGAAPGGSKNWKFDRGGNLTLPNNAVIKDTATNSISFGLRAGDSGQGSLTVAIGSQAGEINQGLQSTAVGSYAGNYNQGIGTVAIGTNAGAFNQGLRAVAIGGLAGAQNQGEYAVALGNFAGVTNQPNNSIVINASGVALNGSASGLFIDPIREVAGTKIVYYNPSTKEITTGPIGLTSNSNVSITSNNNVWTFGTDGGLRTPDNQLTIGGYTIQASNNNEIDLSNGPDLTIKSNVGGVTIVSNWAVNPAEWGFLSDGNLELPNGTRIRDIGSIGSTSGLELGNHGFQINFGSTINDWAIFSGARLIQFDPGEVFNINFGEQGWQFANTGNITFPDGTITSGKTVTVPAEQAFTITLQHDMMAGDGLEPYSFVASYDKITLPTRNGRIFAGPGDSGNEWSLDATNKYLFFPNGDRILYDGNVELDGANYGLNLYTYTKPVIISSGNNPWTFDTNGNLTLPQTAMDVSPAPVSWPGITFSDGTFQNTAYTGGGGGGAAGTVDITDTNGLTTTYYPTFVESRSSGQYMRADVDLTYRTDTNLLRSGNIQVGRNIYGSPLGGISDAIQLRPNISIDKRFLFTVDSSGGNYIRSGMEMPVAEVDKAVTLGFPHANGTVSYIYNQGTDTNGTEWNDALVIFQNGGNVKIGTITGGGTKIWNFTTTGNIVFPDSTVQTTAWNRSAAAVQSTPPASPVTGQLYYDTDDGRTYIYTGAAWIDANPAGAGGSAALDESFGNLTTATGVVTHDCTTNRLFYHTSITANFTANFTNLNLAAGKATSVSLVLVQGATARMVTAVQIAGVAQTIQWQGSAVAPSGNASRIDTVTFSILNVSGTYTVLGMMTSFGGV
jgi:hypothetical protein